MLCTSYKQHTNIKLARPTNSPPPRDVATSTTSTTVLQYYYATMLLCYYATSSEPRLAFIACMCTYSCTVRTSDREVCIYVYMYARMHVYYIGCISCTVQPTRQTSQDGTDRQETGNMNQGPGQRTKNRGELHTHFYRPLLCALTVGWYACPWHGCSARVGGGACMQSIVHVSIVLLLLLLLLLLMVQASELNASSA